MGCVMQVGDQAVNVGRNAALAAGFPETVVGTSIDRQCGSSQQAAHFAAQGVIAGAYDVVIAAGVRTCARADGRVVPARQHAVRSRCRRAVPDLVPQGISAELIAEQWGISRQDNDEFSPVAQARGAGPCRGPLRPRDRPDLRDDEVRRPGCSADEGIRPDSSMETLAKLKPAFKEDGVVTAANSSQITDGAAAMLIMSEEKANELGLKPRARFHAFALAGVDPVTMLTGPIPATTKVLERAKMTLDDIDLVEINEAFAPVVLSWAKELFEPTPAPRPGSSACRRVRGAWASCPPPSTWPWP